MTIGSWMVILAVVFIGMVIGYLYWHSTSNIRQVRIKNIITGALVGLFMGFFIVLLLYTITQQRQGMPERYEKMHYAIYSLERDAMIHGRFTLGTGTIQETNYYFFYVDGELGYLLAKYPTRGLAISEDDNKIPGFYSVYDSVKYRPDKFGLLFFKDKLRYAEISVGEKIVVPTGTITQQFNASKGE